MEDARQFGAGGIQTDLGILSSSEAAQIADRAAELKMYLEATIRLPESASDIDRFDEAVRTARDCGARAIRTVLLSGRRYEVFKSRDEFVEFEKEGRKRIQLATPVVEKYRVPLGIENHKDQRLDERIGLLEDLSCEFVGACLDTGNNVALLDDPHETVRELAPWTVCVHFKDQAVQEVPDGFLLGDIPLGQGMFDLTRMLRLIHEAKPELPVSLELITRNPLHVPCLTEQYWATMPNAPGRDLAHMLSLVREHSANSLPEVVNLNPDERVQRENENVTASFTYARDVLGL